MTLTLQCLEAGIKTHTPSTVYTPAPCNLGAGCCHRLRFGSLEFFRGGKNNLGAIWQIMIGTERSGPGDMRALSHTRHSWTPPLQHNGYNSRWMQMPELPSIHPSLHITHCSSSSPPRSGPGSSHTPMQQQFGTCKRLNLAAFTHTRRGGCGLLQEAEMEVVPKPRSSPQTGELGHGIGGPDSTLECAKFPPESAWLLSRASLGHAGRHGCCAGTPYLCHAVDGIPQTEVSGRLSHLPKAVQVVNSENGGDVMLPAAASPAPSL